MEAEHAEVLLKEIDRELESVTYSGSYVEGIKALKADAERYRWWRDHPADYLWTRDLLSWDSVDAAIDAAMKEEPK